MTYKINELDSFINHKLSSVSDSPLIESDIILQTILKFSKAQLILQNNKIVPSAQVKKIKEVVEERLNHTPLEYLLCSKNFYNHRFVVDRRVLIPRPETELLVDETLNIIDSLISKKREFNILEIGIGSGCIFCSIAFELAKRYSANSKFNFYLTDISPFAISIAKKNLNAILPKSRQYNINFKFFKADIFPKIILPQFDIIVSNPPYIPTSELKTLSPKVKKEPQIALDGGNNGLVVYKKILSLFKTQLNLSKTFFIFEIHSTKTNDLNELIKEEMGVDIDIKVKKDLNSLDRIIIFQH